MPPPPTDRGKSEASIKAYWISCLSFLLCCCYLCCCLSGTGCGDFNARHHRESDRLPGCLPCCCMTPEVCVCVCARTFLRQKRQEKVKGESRARPPFLFFFLSPLPSFLLPFLRTFGPFSNVRPYKPPPIPPLPSRPAGELY